MSPSGFDAVMGKQRGSHSAQDARDREESCQLIRRNLTPGQKLDSWALLPLLDCFTSDDEIIQETLHEAIGANLHSHGIVVIAKTLVDEEVPAIIHDTLREHVVGYLAETQPDGTRRRRIEAGALFSSVFASSRPFDALLVDQALFDAILELFQKDGSEGISASALAQCLGEQEDERLKHYGPWIGALTRILQEGYLDNDYRTRIAKSIGEEGRKSPRRAQAFAQAREALQGRKVTTPRKPAPDRADKLGLIT